jgi:LPXTG-site transpeptidase (sortase) family protein
MSLHHMVAAALILSGVGAAACAIYAGPSASPSEALPQGISNSAPPSVAQASSARHAPSRANRPVGRSLPTRVAIPVIGVNAPVVTVGVQGGTVGAPPLENRNLAGWFTGTVTPGEDGPALLDGHVDTTAGPSVFFGLKDLKAGDHVFVDRQDGSRITFRVTWIQVVSKAAFPWDAVLRTTPGPTLRLVTCGGPFNYATGHYTDNIIVYADRM